MLIVFLVPEVDLKADYQSYYQLCELNLDEPEEPKAVSLADTVADPRAVVVVSGNAMVTVLAMFASKGLFDMTDGAVFVLYEEDYILIIL